MTDSAVVTAPRHPTSSPSFLSM